MSGDLPIYNATDIRLKRSAKVEVVNTVAPGDVDFPIPDNEAWLIWSISATNDRRGWEGNLDYYIDGDTNYYPFPTVPVPPAAAACGCVIAPEFYPILAKTGSGLRLNSTNFVAGDTVIYYILYTQLTPEGELIL